MIVKWSVKRYKPIQGYNTRKVHIETSSLWAEFVNMSRCLSACLVSEEVKSIEF